MSIQKFSFPTQIQFGPGARHGLGTYLREQKLKRPLIVTDAGVSKLPWFEVWVSELRKQFPVAVFSEISGNPARSQVVAGTQFFRAHDADSLVGVGGGAALDVAKAMAVMACHPGDLFDYEDEKPGARAIDGTIPHWVAIPTTAGTGSEVGRSAVISDDQTHIKKIIFSPRLMARMVLADPETTRGLPERITAATGMDALTHCVKAYLAKNFHPICDGVALEGLRLAARSLERAVREPQSLEARSEMMMASMMGAIAFQKGLGLTHSCAHALSTVADLHHGLANGVMIDFALGHNVQGAKARFQTMAEVVGAESKEPAAFLAWLKDLKARIELPAKLSQAGIRQEQLRRLAELAYADSCHQNNPVPCSLEDFERIFQEAYA